MLQTNDLFTQASGYYAAGKLPDAERLVRRLLAQEPEYAPALHLLGALAYQSGHIADALQLFERSIALDPASAAYQSALGSAYQALGRLDQALTCHRRAQELAPQDPVILNNLGVTLMALGQKEEATGVFRQALAGAPEDPGALTNLAAALAEQKEYAEAIDLYRQALARCPHLAQAHNNLGNALRAQGEFAQAEISYRRAIQLWPGFAQAHANLGRLLHARGRLGEALQAYRQALALTPGDVEVLKQLSRALLALNRTAGALATCRQALSLRPDDAEVSNDLGNISYALGNLDQALAHYQEAIGLAPDWSLPHYNRGLALQGQGRLSEARQAFQQALELRPDDAVAHSTYVGSLYYDPEVSKEQILIEHQRWAERRASFAVPATFQANDPDPERPLRVGYVSPDFRAHAVASFLVPILANHDPRQAEAFCYAEVSAPDARTAQLRQLAPQWRFTVGLSDDELAAMIRQDRIDLLVDLAGHTGQNRLLTFARRPAPVQLSYLGYPGTTGLPAIAYRLGDAITDPSNEPDLATEEVVRLPGSFCCYGPPEHAPEVSLELPERRNGFLTLGSLHKLEKLHGGLIELWSAILRDLPQARLLLARDTLHGATAGRLMDRFAKHGIDPERLILRRPQPVGWQHLALYHQIDIALDAFPWNGHTTACEALWMGVPVVTLRGDRHAGRMVTSILNSLRLTDLIAVTTEEYRRRVVALAEEKLRRAELRAGLRARLLASPLCDGAGFARGLEAVYRQLWRRWCALRLSPAGLAT